MNEELLLGLYNTYGLSQFGNFEDFKKDMSSPEIQKGIFETYGLSKYGNFQDFQKDLGFTQPAPQNVDYMSKVAASGFETPFPVSQQNVAEGLSQLNRGLAMVATEPLKMGGQIQQSLGFTSPEQYLLEKTGVIEEGSEPWMLQAGKALEKFTEESNPVSEEFQGSLPGQILQGVGQGIGMIATSGGSAAPQLGQQMVKTGLLPATGRALTEYGKMVVSPSGVIGGSMVAAPEWEAAKQAGLSDEEALGTLIKNYFVGTTEVLPIQNLLGRFAKMTGKSLADVGKAMMSGGFEEFLQEGAQTYLTNMIARGDYDPDRDPLFQVLESAKVGGIVGMILPGMVGAITTASPDVKKKVQAKLDQLEINKTAEEFKTDTPADAEINQIVDDVEEAVVPHTRVTYPTMDQVPAELQEYATTYPTGVVVNAPTDLINKINAVQEPSTTTLPVQPEATTGEGVVTEVQQSQEPTGTGEAQTEEAPVEIVEGDYVDYGGIEGKLRQDDDGNYVVQTADGESVLVEGGKSGLDFETLGLTRVDQPKQRVQEIDDTTVDIRTEIPSNEITYNFENNTIDAYGKQYTYDGIETNEKGETTSIRVIDPNGNTRYLRDPNTIYEIEIQKMLAEEAITPQQVEQAAQELNLTANEPKTHRNRKKTQPVQQTGSVENIETPASAKVTRKRPGRKQPAAVTTKPVTPQAAPVEPKTTVEPTATVTAEPVKKTTVKKPTPVKIEKVSPPVEKAPEPVQPAEQYEPVDRKKLRHNKFTKDEALTYEEDEKETDSGRVSTYISSITVEVENVDGDVIGNLTKVKDEDGIVTWQAEDSEGNILSDEDFDTKDEAMESLAKAWDKMKKKEFDKEVKAKKKAEEKAKKAEETKKAREKRRGVISQKTIRERKGLGYKVPTLEELRTWTDEQLTDLRWAYDRVRRAGGESKMMAQNWLSKLSERAKQIRDERLKTKAEQKVEKTPEPKVEKKETSEKFTIDDAVRAPKATVKTVLQSIADSNSDFAFLAKQLLKIIDEISLNIPVDVRTGLAGYSGQYDTAGDVVVLASELVGFPSGIKTFIHEVIHAATVRKLFAAVGWKYISVGEGQKMTDSNEKALQDYLKTGSDENIKNLIRAFNHVRNEVKNSPADGSKIYGLLNIDEFLAEAFSNTKFQEMLNVIPFDKNKSVWKKIIDAVSKLLGVDVKNQSVLESVLKDGAELIKKPRNKNVDRLYAEFVKAGREFGNLKPETQEEFKNTNDRVKTRAKRRGVKPAVKTEKAPTTVKPTVVTTPQVDVTTQEKTIDEEVARLNKQAEDEGSKTVYNRGVDAQGNPVMFEKTRRVDNSLKLVGKKTYEQIVQEKALQSKPKLAKTEAESLADEFNKSGVILTPAKTDAESGTTTDDSRQENAEKVADFLRNKGITSDQDVADFAEAWNALGIQGARVINKADIKAVTALLGSQKGKPFNNETITATINEVIKNITNHFIKGKTVGVRKGQQLVNRELENLQEILKNSNLNRQQVSAILTRLRKVSFFTPTGVEKLRGFINDVVNDAEFVDKIRTARSLRTKVRKLGRTKSKTISAEIRKFAKQFGTIPVTEFEEKDKIDNYIKHAEMIVNGTKPITSPNYVPVDLGEVAKFVKEAYDKQQREYLRLLNGDLTDTEIEALINDPTELERIMKGKDVTEKEIRDDVLIRAKYAEIALRDVVSSLTGNQKRIVEYLIGADKSKIPTATLMQFVRIADNIVVNKDFSGVLPMVAQIKAPEIIESLTKASKKYKTTFGKLSGALLRSTQSVDNMLNAIYNNRRFIAEFMAQTGLQGVFEAGSQTEYQVEDLRTKIGDELDKVNKKYKVDMNDRKEGVKLAMLAELAKHYDEAGVTHLKSVKNNITESIRQWRKVEPELAKVAEKTFDDFANVKSADEAITVAKTKYPHIHETWKYLVDEIFTEQFSAKAGANTQMVYNTPFLQMKNYLPTTFETVDTTKAGDPETGRDAQQQSVLSTAPKQSPYTLEATRGLQPGKAYNSNYIVGLINAYKKTLYDVNSAESLLTANAVLNTPEFEALVGGLENKNKLNKDLEEMFSFQRGVTGGNSEIEREFSEATAIFREAATGLALGGFDQAPLQFVPGYLSALENLGPKYIKHAGHFAPPQSFVDGVFKKSRTGVRSLRRGGTDIGDVNQLVFTPERRKRLERALTKTLKFTRGAASIALKPLTFSDTNLARTTWTAYYIKSLRDQGIKESEINLSNEAEKQESRERQIARAYADSMISSTQAPSNQAEMSKLARSRGAAGVLRNLLFSFSVFPANFKWRFMQAATKVRHNPKEGSVELASVLTELAVYALMKDYILSFYYDALKDLWREIFGVDEPEKDEEQTKQQKERMFGRMATRIVNDLAPWTLGVGSKLSDITIKPVMDAAYYETNVDKKEYPTYKEWVDSTGGFATKSYESEFSDYGLFGILPDKLMRSYDALEASYNTHRGDETIFYNTPYGEAESDTMGPEMQRMIDLNAAIEGATNIVPFPREFRSTMRQVYKEQLKEPTPESRQNKSKRRERRLQLTPR